MCEKRFIGIIPARYASTRFPGKPLAMIGGKPMIQRVYEQAMKALEYVVVATDDERIAECVRGFGGEVVMTRADHTCGTERCCEALEKVESLKLKVERSSEVGEHLTAQRSNSAAVQQHSGLTGEAGLIIINIQGDEPFIQPEQIKALQGCFEDEQTEIATLVKAFGKEDSVEDLENPNTPKVAIAEDGSALLFSRSVIPYLRGVPKEEWLQRGKFYKHIGMYAYRADVLKEIVQLPLTRLEKAESLEQLRWLENGYKIKVAECESVSIGIDTPADLEKANEFIKNNSY